MDDLDEVTRLVEELARYWARALTNIPYLLEREPIRGIASAAELAAPTMGHVLGYRNGRVRNVQASERLSPSLDGAMPEGVLYRSEAQTDPAARGGGIGPAHFARELGWAQSDGYTCCRVGWFTGNLVEHAFGRRSGFHRHVFRMTRLIDPRVI